MKPTVNRSDMFAVNNTFLYVILLLVIGLLFSVYLHPATPQGEDNVAATFISLKEPAASEKYLIDKKESAVAWKGGMAFGTREKHSGYVYLSKGELIFENSKLTGGTFEIDMNTIEYQDKQHPNSPIKHLKSPDFFDVAKFPTSTFTITRIAALSLENLTVTGNLTIKGITHAVSFPATLKVKDGTAHAVGRMVVDRTKWGIRYKSGKFYDNLADETISDDIEFHMTVIAKKNKI